MCETHMQQLVKTLDAIFHQAIRECDRGITDSKIRGYSDTQKNDKDIRTTGECDRLNLIHYRINQRIHPQRIPPSTPLDDGRDISSVM